MDTYRLMVSPLPLPTVEQTRAFAEHVLIADLGADPAVLPPGDVFVFGLDPEAGLCRDRRSLATWAPGEPVSRWLPGTSLDPRQDPANKSAAAKYRRKFGHWRFWWRQAEPLILAYRLFSVHPKALPMEGAFPVGMPDELVQQCSCRLTAAVRGIATWYGNYSEFLRLLDGLESGQETRQAGESPQLDRARQLARRVAEQFMPVRDAPFRLGLSSQGPSRATLWRQPAKPHRAPTGETAETRELDLRSLLCEEASFQKDLLFKTLMRSRYVFSEICQGHRSPVLPS